MSDSDDSYRVLAETYKTMIDTHYWGSEDESQEDMKFQPGDRVRINAAKGVRGDPTPWMGLLCRVLKSRKPDKSQDIYVYGDQVCILIPLEPRPDTGTMDSDDWFLWHADYLTRA